MHQVINNEIVFTKNNLIIVCDSSFKIKYKRKIRVGLPIRFVFVFPIISKILRKEIFELKKFNDGFAGFFAGYFFYVSDKSFFKYSNFKGNRALRLLYDVINNRLLFGEYFSNGNKNNLKRDEVKIFQFDSSLKMTSPYKFNKNVVRHIHNILLNRFNNDTIYRFNGRLRVLETFALKDNQYAAVLWNFPVQAKRDRHTYLLWQKPCIQCPSQQISNQIPR